MAINPSSLPPSAFLPGSICVAVLAIMESLGWECSESGLPGGDYVFLVPGSSHRVLVAEMEELHGSVSLDEVPLLLASTGPIHRNLYVLRNGWSYWVVVVVPYMTKRLELGII